MKIVVVGGTGRAGARIGARLAAAGNEVVAASPSMGIDAVTGEGLDAALAGAEVVIDAGNAPGADPLEYFTRSTETLLRLESRRGVGHHVLLSIVGVDRMADSPYMRAKVAQEQLVRGSRVPHTIVRATQFHEFVPALAERFSAGDVVRVPAARMQPIALDDVAELVAEYATASPANSIVEIGGPEPMPIAEAVRRVLARAGGIQRVESSADVLYSGARIEDDTLLPGPGARLGREPLR